MFLTDLCPCGSGIAYGDCCLPYITWAKDAPTAEALMRSRYTAYVVHAVDYIMETIHEDTRKELIPDNIKKWSETSEWLGLKIISTEEGYDKDGCQRGIVQFEVYYIQDRYYKTHHETALFEKVGGCWFYKDGRIALNPFMRAGEKTGRNDPCPCGSGKKYKHCCGGR